MAQRQSVMAENQNENLNTQTAVNGAAEGDDRSAAKNSRVQMAKEPFPTLKMPLGYEEICAILPHRYPFLLVDKIVELEPGQRCVGVKSVTANEEFFQGHFPGITG